MTRPFHDPDESGRDEADEERRALWPDMGKVDEDRWIALPHDRRIKALARLKALILHEGDARRRVNAGDAAALAGMGLSTFYAMRDRWKADRSLSSLGVYSEKKAPEGGGDEDARLVRAAIADVLRASPDSGPAAVAHELARMGVSLPFTSLQRLVRAVRRELPVDAPFGGRLVFDNAGADLIDRGLDPQRLCVILDEDTGLVVGWDVCKEHDVHRGYARAAIRALQTPADFVPGAKELGHIGDLSLNGVPLAEDAPEIEFLFSEEQWLRVDVPWRRLFRDGTILRTTTRVGLEVVKTLGERVGPVWIGSGFRPDGRGYRSGRPSRPLRVTVDLTARIGEAIHEHNVHRLGLIRRQASGPSDDVRRAGAPLVESALRAVGKFSPY